MSCIADVWMFSKMELANSSIYIVRIQIPLKAQINLRRFSQNNEIIQIVTIIFCMSFS